MAADPRKTHALVVGIERYDIGESWNLEGPAVDAVRFVNWLVARGVPAGNIWLHLSPLDAAIGGKLTDPNVTIRSATLQEIHRHVVDLIGKTGDLLYLFWGGHGSTVTSRDRRLYYADARSTERLNLQVSALLDFLQSERVRFRQQVAYIDACANLAADPGRLPPDQFPVERPGSQTQQSFFFAAAPGQKAGNDAVLRGGIFSGLVQAALDASPDFPPDPAAVIQQVRINLDGPAQTAVSYESQDWQGEIRTSPGATEGPWLRFASRRLRLASALLEQLSTAFGRCPVLKAAGNRDKLAAKLEARLGRQIYRPNEVSDDPQSDLLRQWTAAWDLNEPNFFKEAFEAIEPFSPESQETADLLGRLVTLREARRLIDGLQNPPELPRLLSQTLQVPPEAGMTVEDVLGATLSQASGELGPFYELLTRVWNELDAAEPGAAALDAFIHQCSDQTREKIRRTLQQEAADMAHFLLVRAVPGPPSRVTALWVREDQRLLRKWDFDCPVDEKTAAEKVVAVLGEIWSLGNFNLSIEIFLLPETLRWTPDLWTREGDFGPERVSTLHPVMVHWVKRWSEPGTAGSWNAAYQSIRKRLEACSHGSFPFVDPDETNVATLAKGLADGSRGPMLALLREVAPKPGERPAGELIAALRAGAPFICWLRESPVDWPAFRNEVTALLTSPAQCAQFDRIPMRVFEARKSVLDNPLLPPAIIGGGLTLLWDDARRNPFENKYRPPA
jgi:hypothetical protein